MQNAINFFEKHSGRFVNVSNERFDTEKESRERFMSAIASCFNCSSDTKIEWINGEGITKGSFSIDALT